MLAVSITAILIPCAAYLLGSIPFGLLLAKLFGGGDVRKAGSGNIGATNVARVVGPLAGVLTLMFDTAKGAAAVWLAGHTAAAPFAVSNISVRTPASGPTTRATLVAPMLPLPALRTSPPPNNFASSNPKGIEPNR